MSMPLAGDAIKAVQDAEREGRMPFIAPEKFYYKYIPQADGSIKQELWVRWVKKGQQTPTAVPEKWERLARDKDNLIYQVLKPYYDQFMKGEATPLNGTSLEAWPGATPELCETLKGVNIRTIEDLARMEDSALQKIAIPGLRDRQKHARAFLDAQQTTSKVSGEIAALRQQNEDLIRRITELTALVNKETPPEVEHMTHTAAPPVAPKAKRGRPAKPKPAVEPVAA